MNLKTFKEIWLVDFEYTATLDGNDVICMVSKEYHTGKTIRMWKEELEEMEAPPFTTDETSLFVAYAANAEMSCFIALGWDRPTHILDLFCEFRCLTNGTGGGSGLLAALKYHGLPHIEDEMKTSMRDLAIRGGPFSPSERVALLAYCETDVIALENLLAAMEPKLHLPLALNRGRYMGVVAEIEQNGIPIDTRTMNLFVDNWESLKIGLIEKVDLEYGVYVGKSFKKDRFLAFLSKHNIPWPMLDSGLPELTADVFKEKAKAYPILSSLHLLRETISRLRLSSLPVGKDGRCRTAILPFSSKTGRNQPRTSEFIFGFSAWVRGLVQPNEGRALAYIDYSQQEFGIAAALSGDENMMAAYHTGDPYLEFAKQAGAVPIEATKTSHKEERERFKSCCLGVNYSMGADSLAERAGVHPIEAQHLIDLHRRTYSKFWEWSESAVSFAMVSNFIYTRYGWTCRVPRDANPRSFANFPMQGNGAEILRLACIYGTDSAVKICAPVHDAVLIEASTEELDYHILLMQDAMVRASRDVLGGFELRSDVKKVVSPERYMDERGVQMWDTVQSIIQDLTSAVPA